MTGDGLCCGAGSVYWRLEHAELQDQRTGAARSQLFMFPTCSLGNAVLPKHKGGRRTPPREHTGAHSPLPRHVLLIIAKQKGAN